MDKAPKTRAGTELTSNNDMKQQLTFVDHRGKLTKHGSVDWEHRFYQASAEFSKSYYWKEDWLTMPLEIWEQLIERYRDRILFVEWYDREEDVAYRVAWDVAREHYVFYNNKIGDRIGIPLSLFTATDRHEVLIPYRRRSRPW